VGRSGKDYIESVAGLWCAALGFDNERLVQAAVTQMRKLPFYHAFAAKSHEPMIDLAEMLIERAPVPMSKVFFANSGSEANDSAIKMVWYFNNALGRPKKKKIIGRMKGYHGITIGSASLTGCRSTIAASMCRCRLHPHDDAASLPRREPRRIRGEFATRCAERTGAN
jgi:4-aminobutyrate--pyruvate transaminase